MNESLRPEVLPPAHSHLTTLIAASVGLGVTGAIVAIATSTMPATEATLAPAPPALTVVEPIALSVLATAETSPPPQLSSELYFVFRAGGSTWVRLADVDGEGNPPAPKHAAFALSNRDDTTAVIGTVADADVPPAYRSLLAKRMTVDGKCHANITGFAVVSRLVGDPGYAGVDGDKWTIDAVAKNGATMLAARLDGCKGTYARDAALAAIVTLAPIKHADLANAGRSALLASEAARATQADWIASGQTGNWYEQSEVEVKVLRHPTTRATWVVAHATFAEMGCGGPNVNVWGLYRAHRDGTLEAVDERRLEAIQSIDAIVDVEGDGDLELLGRPWLGLETVLVDAERETVIDTLKYPFYGCAC